MFHPDGPSFPELARQALSSTERGYDLLAPKFDVTPFRTPPAIQEATARYLERDRPDRALDLCCGTGAMLEVLAPISRRAVGLDFSQGMLEVAASKLGRKVALVRAGATAAPFASAFDLVTCFSALGHFRRRERRELVSSVYQCLRPGGRFLFLTGQMPPKSSPGYWLARGFNAAMHLRNFVWKPPFIMYYLTFLLPEATALLERGGFEVRVVDGLFDAPFERYRLVDAVKIKDERGRADTSVPEAPTLRRRSGP